MSSSPLHILFVADVIGAEGFDILTRMLPVYKDKYGLDLIIANGENGATGKGLTPRLVEDYLKSGVQVITSGNHIWNKQKIFPILNDNPNLLRPLNYPPDTVGRGVCIVSTSNGDDVAVINLQGRSFMNSIDCPFRAADEATKDLHRKGIRVIVVDFHAEATAEKIALGYYLDGRVSAVLGTHTHVQTADAMILDQGTGYMTDVGMTGPADSVIGMDKDTAIRRFISQIPISYKMGRGKPMFCAVHLEIDPKSGKTLFMEPIQIRETP